jgi:peptidyl-prolyl cis-trans isomerase C
MKMKTVVLAALLASPASLVAQTETPEPVIDLDKELNKAVMIVNGENMTVGHLLAYRMTRQGMPLPEDPMQAQDVLVNELFSSMLLAQEATKMGLDKQTQIIARVEVARQQTLRQAALDELIRKQEVSEDEIKAAYKAQHGATQLNEYKTRHILVEDEETAKEIIKDLDDGKDFAELAILKSTGPSGPNGGDLGWIETGRVVKPFGDALAKMEKGKYSSSPVETEFGWHVILLEEKKTTEIEPPSFESVEDQLTEGLKIEAVRKYLENLQNTAVLSFPEGSVVEDNQ